MPFFDYHVKDSSGNNVTGQKEAPDMNTMVMELKSQGYLILKVQETRVSKRRNSTQGGGKEGKIKLDDILVFSRQMATMVGAGIPLVQSLEILSEQTEKMAFRRIISMIKADVEGGKNHF